MVPFLYLAIKSLYLTKGKTLKNQIRDPKEFAEMLMSIIETGELPRLTFIK